MRRIRLTLTDSAIVIAIVALLCSLPPYYRRWVDRDTCRFRGELYIGRGSELAAMADHPEPWMDPFRPDFRRLSAWQLEKGRRLAESTAYDEAAEQRRIAEAGMDRYEVAFDGLYAKFKVAARQHGYLRPSIPLRYYPGYEFGAFFAAWPFYGGVVLLGPLLVGRRRRAKVAPGVRSQEAVIEEVRKGSRVMVASLVILAYSLVWTLFSGGPPFDRDAGIWDAVGRMFRLTGGHAILTAFGLMIFALGFYLTFVFPWRTAGRRERASSPENVRADGPGQSD